jgi:hypothetical protein
VACKSSLLININIFIPPATPAEFFLILPVTGWCRANGAAGSGPPDILLENPNGAKNK